MGVNVREGGIGDGRLTTFTKGEIKGRLPGFLMIETEMTIKDKMINGRKNLIT